jgi:hypothetical protein
MLATCAIRTIEVTPTGATYALVAGSLPSNEVFVLNVFNGINAIIFPL